MEKNYEYFVNNVRSVDGNKITCSVVKARVNYSMSHRPIYTSLNKWIEQTITLTDKQMERFNHYKTKDDKRAYLTKLLVLS